MGRNWKNFEEHGRKHPDYLEQIVGRNMDMKGAVSEDSDGNEEHVIGN